MKKYLDALSFFKSYRSPLVVILLICLITGVPRSAFAATWSPQGNAPQDNLTAYATSANGKYILATGDSGGGHVYISTNYGASFSSVYVPDSSVSDSVAVSSSGQDMVLVEGQSTYTGNIFLSTDYGSTWTQVGPSQGINWSTVTMSGDGQHIMAGSQTAGVEYLSNDGGTTWSEPGQNSLGALNSSNIWEQVAYSQNGNYLVAAATNGDLAVSTNHGTSWTDGLEATSTLWGAVGVSNSGKIVAGGTGDLYISNNAGTSWIDTHVSNVNPWGSISMASNGSVIAAASTDYFGSTTNYPGYIYLSNDGGTSFVQQTSAGSRSWGEIALNSNDGSFGYAPNLSGYQSAYYYAPPTDTTPPVVVLTNPAASSHLSGTVTLTATATDNVGVTGIQYYVNGTPYGALGYGLSPYSIPWNTTGFSNGTTTLAVVANDYAGNYATSTEQVFVDNTPPVITVLGANPATVANGATYTDAGATATDLYDGNLTSSIVKTGTVNTSVAGTYTITYSVTNSAGDVATSTRTVNVQAAPVTPTVQSSGGSSYGGGTVTNQVSNLLQNGNTSAAAALEVAYPSLFANGASTGKSSTSPASSTGNASAPTSTTLPRALTLGMTGADVKALQEYLNAHGFTVASSGAGSPGNETTYFGKATRAALAKFQKAHGITPAAGYFGSITRAFVETHP